MDDFRYFFFENNIIKEASSLSLVPKEILDYSRIMDAVDYFQLLGMMGMPIQDKQPNLPNGKIYEYYDLYWEVLKIAYNQYKQTFPLLYRGYRKERPDSDYRIIYTTPSLDVAKFYGDNIKEYRNVDGLLTHGCGKSVVTGEWNEIDDEVLLIPAHHFL